MLNKVSFNVFVHSTSDLREDQSLFSNMVIQFSIPTLPIKYVMGLMYEDRGVAYRFYNVILLVCGVVFFDELVYCPSLSLFISKPFYIFIIF